MTLIKKIKQKLKDLEIHFRNDYEEQTAACTKNGVPTMLFAVRWFGSQKTDILSFLTRHH